MDEDVLCVVIYEAAFEERGDLHTFVAQELNFPDYYGRNLDAFADCLGDISEPTLVGVVRMRNDPEGEEPPLSTYFDKLCLCLMRAARENPWLDCEIVFES